MSDAPHTPCATCGRCCRSYIVPVCGYDVWRISVSQHLAPDQFLVAVARDQPQADGFLLASGGRSHVLMLDKQGRLAAKRPCVFLLHLAGGHDRCGIYADRPVVCRAYPMVWRREGGIAPRTDALCPPDAWPADAGALPAWQQAVRHVDMRFDVYSDVVARWNARVRAWPERRFALGEYFSFVFNVYERLAELDRSLGEAELARVIRTWRRAPSPDADLTELRARAAEYPWVDYLFRARCIVGGFYDELTARAEG